MWQCPHCNREKIEEYIYVCPECEWTRESDIRFLKPLVAMWSGEGAVLCSDTSTVAFVEQAVYKLDTERQIIHFKHNRGQQYFLRPGDWVYRAMQLEVGFIRPVSSREFRLTSVWSDGTVESLIGVLQQTEDELVIDFVSEAKAEKENQAEIVRSLSVKAKEWLSYQMRYVNPQGTVCTLDAELKWNEHAIKWVSDNRNREIHGDLD